MLRLPLMDLKWMTKQPPASFIAFLFSSTSRPVDSICGQLTVMASVFSEHCADAD